MDCGVEQVVIVCCKEDIVDKGVEMDRVRVDFDSDKGHSSETCLKTDSSSEIETWLA